MQIDSVVNRNLTTLNPATKTYSKRYVILLKINPTKYDMVIVKATNPNDTNSIWKFSQLDLNLLKMVIKGLWVYDILLDENEMKASLGMVLNHYPHLSGRVEHNGRSEERRVGKECRYR